MNPTDIHIWMSASKPTVGLLVAMLADEGKIDLDKPVPTYVPEIRGTAWEQATVRNVMNMSNGLDTEENIENLLNPDSWIANWFTAAFELNKGDFREMSKNAKPLPGESAGDHFRYSGANTQTLVLATQNTAPTGSAKSLTTTRPSGTMSSTTAPCSSTATWGRGSMSIPPAISAACISAWRPTRMKSRESIIRRDICATRRKCWRGISA